MVVRYGENPLAAIKNVKEKIAGRVSGVLLPPAIVRFEAKRGTNYITPFSELQNAGIPVAPNRISSVKSSPVMCWTTGPTAAPSP